MKIISIHTPKAGGTTMLALWKEAFGEDGVLMDYADPPVNPAAEYLIDPIGWAERRPRDLPASIKVVHGHYKPEKYDLLDNAFRMTILRHPIDNLISIYFYWKKIPPQPNAIHQYFLANDLDILGLARLPIMQNLLSETYFGGWDMRKLDFIGRHEQRSSDLKALAKILDIDLNSGLHLNATEPEGVDEERDKIRYDEKLIRELTVLLANDIQFYEKYL